MESGEGLEGMAKKNDGLTSSSAWQEGNHPKHLNYDDVCISTVGGWNFILFLNAKRGKVYITSKFFDTQQLGDGGLDWGTIRFQFKAIAVLIWLVCLLVPTIFEVA